ncbi:cytochrome P450, partial [Streptomyces clavuligerus]
AQTLAGPLAPGSLPLVGHALRLARRPEAFLTSLPAQGDLVRVRLGMIDTYVVCAPEVMHRVLSDTEVFEKGGPIYDKAREGAGNGIITCHNTEHPQQRKVVWPAFRRALLPGQAAIMTEQIDRSTASWHDGQTLDLIPHTSEISAAVSAKVFFPSLPDHEITELTHAFDTFLVGLFRRMTWPSALQEKLPTPGNRRYRDARDHLRRTVSRLVHDPHAADEQTGLLATILAARDTLDPPPTDEEIQGQIFNLLIAGIDTTAST